MLSHPVNLGLGRFKLGVQWWMEPEGEDPLKTRRLGTRVQRIPGEGRAYIEY